MGFLGWENLGRFLILYNSFICVAFVFFVVQIVIR